MKISHSLKLSGLSAIRTGLVLPAMALVLAALLTACSGKEEPTPLKEPTGIADPANINTATAREIITTGLAITSDGNDITITVGIGGSRNCFPGDYSCRATRLYQIVLGRDPESEAVIESTASAIEANGYAATRLALATSDESRQNIIDLYTKALKRRRKNISEEEIANRQAFLAENSDDNNLVALATSFAHSQEAINKGLNINVEIIRIILP